MKTIALLLSLAALAVPGLAQAPTEQHRNKAVARSFFEDVLDKGNLEHYADSHAAEFVVHAVGGNLPLSADIAAAREERKALPDMHMTINQIIAERDLVSVYWTATGTNTHEGMGLPATGKHVVVPGMTLFRFANGKIVEEWSVYDMLSVMQQLGLSPSQQQ